VDGIGFTASVPSQCVFNSSGSLLTTDASIRSATRALCPIPAGLGPGSVFVSLDFGDGRTEGIGASRIDVVPEPTISAIGPPIVQLGASRELSIAGTNLVESLELVCAIQADGPSAEARPFMGLARIHDRTRASCPLPFVVDRSPGLISVNSTEPAVRLARI